MLVVLLVQLELHNAQTAEDDKHQHAKRRRRSVIQPGKRILHNQQRVGQRGIVRASIQQSKL
ncbi:hypothetical protein D3C84_1109060 [compost metagenome]